ncbi:hypothetical protein [Hymenobacter yonginensis]|uniref:Uncharacterized protein n=1 Tax=Hymenobacter yonginensis TaxID=748197 RepID=A0ABY7PQY0_9BACT|nr:hypothetical protein [Hymenobacter yonginensis]WBO85043.1 hypothetical protein O9Z63_02105 [Hymenobacter yonginensis]
MFISGLTTIRNAFVNGYPVVDEMVVSISNSRRWYARELRFVRNAADIRSYKDAQSFRRANGDKLRMKPANASVYHYSWVKNLQLPLAVAAPAAWPRLP